MHMIHSLDTKKTSKELTITQIVPFVHNMFVLDKQTSKVLNIV